eukprot:CFRG2174T1
MWQEEFVPPSPTRFRFGLDGEVLMLMNAATRYLSKPAGSLLSYHPGLWSRKATHAERSQLIDRGIVSLEQGSFVTLLRADEVDEINKDSLAYTDPPTDTFGKHNGLGIGIKTRALDRSAEPTPTPSRASDKIEVLKRTEDYIKTKSYMNSRARRPGNPLAIQYRIINEIEARPDVIRRRADVVMVPITIEASDQGYLVRDNIMWNLNEPIMTPIQFATHLCLDAEVPLRMTTQIVEQMTSQIEDYVSYQGQIDLPSDELRIPIRVQVHVGNRRLVDMFEWDVKDPNNDPETFALSLCSDLGLGGEYAASIAHSIHEQILQYKKTMVDAPHEREDVKTVSFPPLRYVKHDQYGPRVDLVSEQTIEQFYQGKSTQNTGRSRRSRQRGQGQRRSARSVKDVNYKEDNIV